MASRSTLPLLLLSALLRASAAEVCDAGDASCAARASALLQHGARQKRAEEESLYGSSDVFLCKDSADYDPTKEMWAWCDFYSVGVTMPSESSCNAEPGCYGAEGWCHCEDKASCLAVGGFWNAHTCEMELDMWRPEQTKMLKEADERGTCLDLEVDGMRAMDLVSWPAQQCCASFPASVCDKTLTAQTPCLIDGDFLHNKTMWAWCEGLYPAPPEHDCLAQGCTGNEHYCNCETAEACSALGGRWTEYQCWQDLKWMAAQVHKGIKQAKEQGTCEDVEVYHSKLEYQVDWLGTGCCASGMSVCQELGSGGSSMYNTAAGR